MNYNLIKTHENTWAQVKRAIVFEISQPSMFVSIFVYAYAHALVCACVYKCTYLSVHVCCELELGMITRSSINWLGGGD